MNNHSSKTKTIITLSLLIIMIFICFSWINYSNSLSIVNERVNQEQYNNVNTTEPKELIEIDKRTPILDYLNNIHDEIIIHHQITSRDIITWENYEVINIKYIKQITDDYYTYEAELKINSSNIEIPSKIAVKNNGTYMIIKLSANFIKKNNDFIVKSIEFKEI